LALDLSTYLAILRRWWVTLLVGTWVAALVGYALASQIQPVYESRARVLVGPINADVDTLRASSFLVVTYGELVESDQVLQQTIDSLGLDTSVGRLRDDVTTTANDQTRFLTIRARNADSQAAAGITQALVDQLIALSTRETRRPEGSLQVVNAASVEAVPVSPQVPIVVGLAAFAGLLGAILLVSIIELTARSVRTRAELVRAVPAESLGEINRPRGFRRPRRAPADSSGLVAGPEYGEVAARLVLAGTEPPRVAVVLGTAVDEASDVVAAKLALALAGIGHSVTLVDANDVEPVVTRLFASEIEAAIPGEIGPAHAGSVVRVRERLQLVPNESTPEPSVQLDGFVDALLARAGIVVVSAAPLGVSARAVQWLRVSDVVVLAVRRYRTRRDAAAEAAETIAVGTDSPLATLLHEEDPVRDAGGPAAERDAVAQSQVGPERSIRRDRRPRPSSAHRNDA
jgi:polysaccharide biosynthesis transport protein